MTLPSRVSRSESVLVAMLLATQALLLAWIAWRNSPALDEVAHLAAGLHHLDYRRTDVYRVNPPLVHTVAALAITPMNPRRDWARYENWRQWNHRYIRPEMGLGHDFFRANGVDSLWYFRVARWACLPFSLLGAWICYRWSRELYGSTCGVLALALWVFCPNILGNGSLIGNDVAAASMACAATYAFWCWVSRPSWARAVLTGAAFGLAQLTKTSMLVLAPVWLGIWLCCHLAGGRHLRESGVDSRPKRTFLQFGLILALGVSVINLGYGFEGSFRRLGEYRFISHTLGGANAHESPGNRFDGGWSAALPVPLPENYVLGIDNQKYDFERGKWCYLRGVQQFRGWGHFYLYALLVKVPVGTWLLLAMAVALRIRDWRRGNHDWSQDAVLLLPACVFLGLVSSQTGFTRYLRYALPVLPFVYIWISRAAVILPTAFEELALLVRRQRPRFRRCWGGTLVAAATVGTIGSSLLVWPHSLSYFNEFVGGPDHGSEHLLDANIDWGQDLLRLKEWADAHAQSKPLYVTYFGPINPADVGMRCESLRIGPERPDGLRATTFPPGWHAVSVNALHDYRHDDRPQISCEALRELKPVARIGHSILVFHLDRQKDDRWWSSSPEAVRSSL